jgi:hypothetical protein
MKITAIKTCVVNAEMRNWVFVKLQKRTAAVGAHQAFQRLICRYHYG